jgi:hypothetical protein
MSKDPLVLAYGLGRDSTAILVGWHQRGIRPDHIVFADVGAEKSTTYEYLDVIRPWLKKVGFPELTIVKYVPQKAPYDTIEGNCCQNCTLPSETFGFGACSIKWKQQPQDKWAKNHPELGKIFKTEDKKIIKAIGYEFNELGRKEKMEKAKTKALEKENASLAKRNAKKQTSKASDRHYEYIYPLIEWEWTLERCIEEIKAAGLPVPPKSSCFFCPNIRPDEVRELTDEERGRIMRIEMLAEPYNEKVYGLWRRDRKRDGRPGSITEFILKENLSYVHPDDLPDEMPRNPACGKAKRGYTFMPPHREVSLKELLAAHEEQKLIPDFFNFVEDELHTKLIDRI